MKKIYDIFAKSKKQLKNPKQDKQLKIPIIIDTREKQSFVVSELIEKGKIKMKVYPTTDKWYGLTNPEDEEKLRAELANL